MKHGSVRTILVVALLLLGTSRATADSLSASIGQLEMAVTPQRGGDHLNLLFALRQLQAPAMRPLFYKLVQHEEWAVQVHAVLGLAALSESKQIDPWLVRQMNPNGHDALIANALDLGMLDPEQMRELIRHDELGPMPRLLVLSELVSLDEQASAEQLQKLCDHADLHVSALAAAALVQTGDESKFSAVRQRLASMSNRERQLHLQWLFEAIRQYEFTALLPWIKQTLNDETLDEPVQFAAVFALAELGDSDVMGFWSESLGAKPRHVQLIRYALILLVCADEVPLDAFDQLPADDVLLQQIAATGRAIRSQRNQVLELKNLLDLEHRKSTDLAMPHIKNLSDTQAADIYGHLIDRLARTEAQNAETIAVGVRATGELMKIDPILVLNRLKTAEDDSIHQQAILLGLMDVHDESVGEAASTIRRIGAGRADSLALLLMAKNLPTLEVEQINRLGMIASGGGRVSAVLQTQAAWLYVQHTGNVEKALGRLFPGS